MEIDCTYVSSSPGTQLFICDEFVIVLLAGSNVKPREELLSLLSCGSASAALHQFLAASLGEAVTDHIV